ncbi:hypothetical protein PATSB16_14790 [Pandoraea thiooxydans]|nr:hypothetical protein PATSB16_14790 [Pandoraea thiooxydans]
MTGGKEFLPVADKGKWAEHRELKLHPDPIPDMHTDIRPLFSHDAMTYQALRLRGLQESPTAFSASFAEERDRTLADITPRVTPAADGSKCVFGAFRTDTLVGMVTILRPQAAKVRHCAQLAGMYVDPGFRRRGIGRALLGAVIDHARAMGDVRQLRLGVNADNTGARQLYEAVGFSCFGIEPDALHVDGRFYGEAHYVLRLDRRT